MIGPDTELHAKEVKLRDHCNIVCRNLLEAAQAARTREAVLAMLRAKLRQGLKSLVEDTLRDGLRPSWTVTARAGSASDLACRTAPPTPPITRSAAR
jgi:hypothetical protein